MVGWGEVRPGLAWSGVGVYRAYRVLVYPIRHVYGFNGEVDAMMKVYLYADELYPWLTIVEDPKDWDKQPCVEASPDMVDRLRRLEKEADEVQTYFSNLYYKTRAGGSAL